MKQSIDAGWDDPPADPGDQVDTPPVWWIVNLVDDVEGIDDIRVQLVFEVPGTSERIAAHLTPATVRRLRAALASALTTIGGGDDPGP